MFSFEYTEVYVVMLLVNVIIKHSQYLLALEILGLRNQIFMWIL